MFYRVYDTKAGCQMSSHGTLERAMEYAGILNEQTNSSRFVYVAEVVK